MTETEHVNQGRRQTDPQRARELIAFRIGAQEFCVDIMSVREIRGWTTATALPQSPSFVRGVVNLRGAVLPIVDLSARLGFPRPNRPRATSSSSRRSAISPSGFSSMRCPTFSRSPTICCSRRRTSPRRWRRSSCTGVLAIDSA